MRSSWLALGLGALLVACGSNGDPDSVAVTDDDGNASAGGNSAQSGTGGAPATTGTGGDPSGPTSGTGTTTTGTGGAPPMENCGDGNLDLGEECDGDDLGGATCDSLGMGEGELVCTAGCMLDPSDCETQGVCGDGIVGPGEECDDTNAMPLDGCSATCQYEGHACVPRETAGVDDENVELCVCGLDSFCCDNAWDSICVASAIGECAVNCGDPCAAHTGPGSNDVQVTECVCDVDVGCCDGNWGAGCTYVAQNDCGACTPNPVCGNGDLESGEQCDDGDMDNGDGCSSLCKIEAATCGNAIVEGNEECDDDGTANGDGCSSTCQFEGSACVPRETPGVASEAVEACVCDLDGFCCSNAWDTICVNEAINECAVNCGSPCSVHSGPGSNDVQVTQCVCALDDFCCDVSWDSTCVTEATNDCNSCAQPVCGNGVLEPGEQCDDGDLTNNDGCDSDCAIENAICGNSAVEVGEECDDGDASGGDGCSGTCQYEGHACVPRETPGVSNETVEACVCELDSFCCNVAWDAICVDEAMSGCAVSCGAPCTAHANPGSNDTDVTACVCAIDSFCCTTSWDAQCASEAQNDCGACSTCGNGVKETGEECDDGDQSGGDGCSSLCQFEGHECVPRSTPGTENEDVESCVCALDSFCCSGSGAWDEYCVAEAIDSCSVDCGDACDDHPSPGSNDPWTTSCVCSFDDFCCENEWDGVCVFEAFDSCFPPLCD